MSASAPAKSPVRTRSGSAGRQVRPGATTAPASRLARALRTRSTLVAVLLLVGGSMLLNVAHVRFYPQLSPVDELQHIDYLYKAPDIVRNGEKVGQEAMREEACRGLSNYAAPACSLSAAYDPVDFQELGTNTAAVYTPFYYTVTKIVAEPIRRVLGLDSLVTAARLVGGLWLAGGLVVTFLVARRLGAHPYPTAALLLAAAATPNVILPAATITPDAAALFAGAAMVWSVLWWEDSSHGRWWLPTVIGLAVVMLKALNLIVVVLVALYILVRHVQRRYWPEQPSLAGEVDGRVTRRRAGPTLAQSVFCIAVVSLVALAGAAGYVLFSQSDAVASSEGVSMAARVHADAFPVDGFLSHVGVFLQVFYAPGWWVTVPLLGPLVQDVVGLVVFAGTFAAGFLVDRLSASVRALAGSLLVVGLVGAPLIIAFSFFSSGMYVPIPGRYALTLVPTGLAVASAAMQRRSARVITTVLGLGCYAVTLLWLLAH